MATKKAAGKPRGYADELWKAYQKLQKAGKSAEAKKMFERWNEASKSAGRQAAGDKELKNQWGRIVTKSLETDKRAVKATGAAKAREESRARGIRARAEALGARQQADIGKAKDVAAGRAEARKRAAENRAKRSAAQARARRARRNAK